MVMPIANIISITRCIDRRRNVPLGRVKAPVSEPLVRARLKREVNCASGTLPSELLARTYFLRAWRLLGGINVSKVRLSSRVARRPCCDALRRGIGFTYELPLRSLSYKREDTLA